MHEDSEINGNVSISKPKWIKLQIKTVTKYYEKGVVAFFSRRYHFSLILSEPLWTGLKREDFKIVASKINDVFQSVERTGGRFANI